MEEGGEQRGRHHHSRGGVSGRRHSSRRLLLGEKRCSHGLCKPQVSEEASFFFLSTINFSASVSIWLHIDESLQLDSFSPQYNIFLS